MKFHNLVATFWNETFHVSNAPIWLIFQNLVTHMKLLLSVLVIKRILEVPHNPRPTSRSKNTGVSFKGCDINFVKKKSVRVASFILL